MSFKKISILSIVLFFLFIGSISAKEIIVDENNLNVRSGPSTDYERVGQVHQGESYHVVDENEEWIKIQLKDVEGWVSKEFITISNNELSEENEAEKPKDTPTVSTVTIQTDRTHLREGASTDFDIVAFTEKGQAFDVLSETENWIEISDGETTGYVLRNHIETTNSLHTNNLRNKTIVIDPGHGGRDVGAIGISGTFEKYFTYLTAHELEKELVALGAEVILTRHEDEFVPLESRTSLANALETDAFLSIHYNSFPEMPSVTGIETFFYHDQYKILASLIHDEIVTFTDERDRGISFSDFHVTRQTFKPGVLLELGFISHNESEALLQTTAYQKKLVAGIISGLQKYFTIHP